MPFIGKMGGEGVEVAVVASLFASNKVFVGLERFDSNTADLHNVLRLFERTILFPVVYNALGIGWPNALQGAEFIH
jgi:cadmium resistance protein CadD (predicted permease)